MDLIKSLENTIEKEKLFKKSDSFVIGVSGGADSVTLLYSLIELSKTWKFKIVIAHLNHGLRKEAGSDERFVKSLAKKNNLPFYTRKVSLKRANVEEAGREARYEFFEEIWKQTGSKYIVTAHNLNDNAETVLLNLTRGAGLSGLSGMKIKENNLIRPLLNIKKDDVLVFAKRNKLKWREDPSNRLLEYSRNRIRRKVLPELTKINDSAKENIVRSASILREASVYLKNEAESYYQKNVTKNDGVLFLALDKIKKLDPYLQKGIIQIFLEKNDSWKHISQQNLEALLSITRKGGTKEICLSGGLIIRKEYDKLMIVIPHQKAVKQEKVFISPNEEIKFSEYIIISKYTKNAGKSTKDSVYVDVEKTGKLVVRSKKEGDRVSIGKDQTKKVQDIFVDAKIPRAKRDSYPVVENESGDIVWVPRLRQSEKFRATKKTKRILNLKVKIYEKKIS
ncbi:tRNA lysidine(34) synthetase TilS [bacterium (Candidatus Howlettbacteria) CG_4_10_14_0_8_um_filter_40_9]|nr:MAG: tRNA lysidine(34) synthetase TilS [bacterium (Candidatus Howlettbacteria) CG_4_10_14_0_8_um_filter_40_9]